MAKVLLVEDDENLRSIYADRLAAEGYQILSARDGDEALSIAMKERPDLIISDVMMPKISGFDMLDIIRSTKEIANTKVIMMTALSQKEDQERGEALGADRYLVKSQVTLEDVVKVAAEVLNEAGVASPKQSGGESMSSSNPGPSQTVTPAQAAAANQQSETKPPAAQASTPPAPAEPAADQQPAAAEPAATDEPAEPTTAAAPPAVDGAATDGEPAATDPPAAAPEASTNNDTAASNTSVQQAEADPAIANAPSAADEKAEVSEQIENYSKNKVQEVANAAPAEPVGTASEAPPPATQPAPAKSTPPAVEDTKQASATNETESPAEQRPPAPAASAQPNTEEQTTAQPTVENNPAPAEGEQSTVAGGKVIQPIDDPSMKPPDINQLYKEEVARENQAQPGKTISPTQPSSDNPPADPANSSDDSKGSSPNPNEISL